MERVVVQHGGIGAESGTEYVSCPVDVVFYSSGRLEGSRRREQEREGGGERGEEMYSCRV